MQSIEQSKVLKIFISYAHAEQDFRNKLEDHLSSLKYSGKITIWQDKEIPAGADWEDQINMHLDEADIILLLVSASFIASKYCWSKEVQTALERHKTGKVHVIPLILKPVHWRNTPLGQIHALPRGAKPVTQWHDQDAAFENVVQGIRKVVEDLTPQRRWSRRAVFLLGGTALVGAGLTLFAVLQSRDVSPSRVTTPAGLVGWWRAEANTFDSAGTNNGALRGGVDFVPGKVGEAFLLDGVSGYIEIPDAPALRPTSVTLETWVAFDTYAVQAIISKPVGVGTSDSYTLWLDPGSGTLRGEVGDAAGEGIQLITAFSPYLGEWYHLAYTFDESTYQQALYIDGRQVAMGITNKSIGYDAQPVFLGRDTNDGIPSYFLQGRIDEASIYNRALNGAEIASIYNAGSAGKRLLHP